MCYQIELEKKDKTNTVKSASHLDLHLNLDNKNKTLRQKRLFLIPNC